MSSFEWNKIIGAVLVALLAVKTFDIVGSGLVSPKMLAENVYVVAGAEAAPTTAAAQAAPAALEPIGPLLAAASVDAGRKAANKCAACHTFDKGGANRVGPNLWGIVGSNFAHLDGYAYSSAIKQRSGETWDYEKLNAFIANPRAAVPGNKMSFAGVRSANERAEIIAFLRSLSDNPAPLP